MNLEYELENEIKIINHFMSHKNMLINNVNFYQKTVNLN